MSITTASLVTQFTPFMERLVEESARAIVPHFNTPDLQIDTKKDASPVTAADRNAEEMMRSLVRKHYPDHGVIGEEFGSERADAEFVWVFDPIDGTISFTHACPLFGTLIALLYQGIPILGAINQPILRQLCLGDGAITTLNGKKISVRTPTSLSQATLLGTDFEMVKRFQDERNFRQLIRQVRLTRTWGDCYGYLLLASGNADIMMDPVMNPWDLLPLVPIIKGAGGAISTWQGGDILKGNSAVASHPFIHEEVIAILNDKLGHPSFSPPL